MVQSTNPLQTPQPNPYQPWNSASPIPLTLKPSLPSRWSWLSEFSLHHSHGPGHNHPEESLPSFLWYQREYVQDLHHQTDPSITPVQHAHMQVPIEYWDWVHPGWDSQEWGGCTCLLTYWMGIILSLSHKPDGTLHICCNPKDMNKAIVQEHYEAHTLNEISHCLSRATCFSKLDAKDGFWSIHLDEASSYLTIFNMLCGSVGSCICQFSFKMSQDVFQMWMDQATGYLPGIIAMHDDICIYGHTPGSLTNTSCHWWRQPKSTLLSSTALSINQAASDCLLWHSIHCPRNATRSLQNSSPPRPPYHWLPGKASSFLGLINYLQPFIPSLSTKMMFLHEQLAEWDWNSSTDAVFQCLKAWICQTLVNATLVYYDRSKPVIVQMDASKYGLGAALIQSGPPIAFASKTLTDIETHYANIEWGCLGNLGWTVHWCQPTPQGDNGMHSPGVAQLHSCWSAWCPSRDWQDASSGERGCVLAQHRHWHFQLCPSVHHMH